MRKVLLNLMVILSVFSVQGCWAGGMKSETSKDAISMESDSTDAATDAGAGKSKVGRYVVGKTEFMGPTGHKIEPAGDLSVCREFADNLNAFVNEKGLDYPVFCEVPIHSDKKDFTLPPWKPVPENQYEELANKIVKNSLEGSAKLRIERDAKHLGLTVEEYAKKRAKQLLDKFVNGANSLEQARFDIDNDQKLETVLKSEETKKADYHCGRTYEVNGETKTVRYAPSHYALDENGNIDEKLSRSLNFPKGLRFFLYKNRTYALQWNYDAYEVRIGKRPEYLTVYQTRFQKSGHWIQEIPVCEIEYQSVTNQSGENQ